MVRYLPFSNHFWLMSEHFLKVVCTVLLSMSDHITGFVRSFQKHTLCILLHVIIFSKVFIMFMITKVFNKSIKGCTIKSIYPVLCIRK